MKLSLAQGEAISLTQGLADSTGASHSISIPTEPTVWLAQVASPQLKNPTLH